MVEGFPAGEELEFGECDGDLGLVVCVAEFLGVFFVQFGGEREVGVNLEGERFAEGENLVYTLIPAYMRNSMFSTYLGQEGNLRTPSIQD